MTRRARGVLAAALWLALAASATAQTPAGAVRIKVTAEQANLREKPDIGSSILQQIPEGTVLEADRKEGEWYFVRYTLEDGGVIGGWLHESLVEPVPAGPPVTIETVQPAAPVVRPAPPDRAAAARSATGGLPLEISVSAGIATFAPRDLNDAARGFPGWLGGMTGLASSERAGILHAGTALEVELAYRWSARLALGLGAGYVRASNADRVVLSDELSSWTASTKPSVTSAAAKLTARFYPGAGFYLRGALGLYTVKAGYFYRYEGSDAWGETRGSASATSFGGEAAFGGEWAVGRRTAFFVEAGLRMVAFDRLDGENTDMTSADERLVETGTLYYYGRIATDGVHYPLVSVRASPPAGTDYAGTRAADVNLSGMAIRAGIRYRF